MSDAAMTAVFDHFHARRRGDLDAIAAGLDPDVVHQGVIPELVCNGRAAVLDVGVLQNLAQRAPAIVLADQVLGNHRLTPGAGRQERENPADRVAPAHRVAIV